jgi:hypothetical protein
MTFDVLPYVGAGFATATAAALTAPDATVAVALVGGGVALANTLLSRQLGKASKSRTEQVEAVRSAIEDGLRGVRADLDGLRADQRHGATIVADLEMRRAQIEGEFRAEISKSRDEHLALRGEVGQLAAEVHEMREWMVGQRGDGR